MKVDTRFWKNKKVLITGHTGFKGAWLAYWLHARGAEVMGYSLQPPYTPNCYELLSLEKSVNSVIGDINSQARLKAEVNKFKPDIVFHLAAQSLVRPSYAEPVETFQTNVIGTANLLEALREIQSAKAVVLATSDKCYENLETGRSYKEGDPLGGHDPYSASKAAAEIIIRSYYLSFFKNGEQKTGIASVRAGNVIGGGDWSTDRLVPDAVRAICVGSPVQIRNPHSVRPWQHVFEALSGYILLAEKLFNDPDKFSRPWNFGPNIGAHLTVKDFMDTFTGQWGCGASWSSTSLNDAPHEAKLLHLDISDAQRILNWAPRLSIKDAIAMSVEWYRGWQAGTNLHELSLKQLNAYEKL